MAAAAGRAASFGASAAGLGSNAAFSSAAAGAGAGSAGPAELRAGGDEDDGQNLWSCILSEVSTRSRSKLPSGKNVLLLGQEHKDGHHVALPGGSSTMDGDALTSTKPSSRSSWEEERSSMGREMKRLLFS